MKIFFTRLNHGFKTLKKSCISEEILTRHCAVFCPHVFRDTAHFVTFSDHFSELRNPFFQTLKNTLQSWNWVLKASSFSVTQFQNRHFGTYIPAFYFVIHVWNLESADRFWSLLCVWKLTFTHPQTRARHTAAGCTRIWSCENVLCVFQACSEFRVFEGRRGTGGEEEQRRPVHHGVTCREGVGEGAGLTVLGQSQKLLGDWQTAQPMTVTSRRHDIMRAFSAMFLSPAHPSQLHMLFVNNVQCVWHHSSRPTISSQRLNISKGKVNWMLSAVLLTCVLDKTIQMFYFTIRKLY